MDYIFLFLAVFCFVGEFLFTKLYERSVKQAVFTSLIFFTLSSLVSVLIFLPIAKFRVEISGFSLLISAITAIIYLLYKIISIKILSLGNVGIYSMYMMLGGMALPVVYGVCFLKEGLSPAKIIGLIVLSFALIFQVWGEKTDKATRRIFYILCFAIFIINGMTGVVAKFHQISPEAVNTESYMILYSGIGAAIGAVITAALAIAGRKGGEIKFLLSSALSPKGITSSVLCSAASGIGNFLLLIAALTVPASVQYPIVSGGTIVISAIGAFIFYKEKPNKRSIFCLILAFASTFLFMF